MGKAWHAAQFVQMDTMGNASSKDMHDTKAKIQDKRPYPQAEALKDGE